MHVSSLLSSCHASIISHQNCLSSDSDQALEGHGSDRTAGGADDGDWQVHEHVTTIRAGSKLILMLLSTTATP